MKNLSGCNFFSLYFFAYECQIKLTTVSFSVLSSPVVSYIVTEIRSSIYTAYMLFLSSLTSFAMFVLVKLCRMTIIKSDHQCSAHHQCWTSLRESWFFSYCSCSVWCTIRHRFQSLFTDVSDSNFVDFTSVLSDIQWLCTVSDQQASDLYDADFIVYNVNGHSHTYQLTWTSLVALTPSLPFQLKT